jgi:DNA topoisomerase-1
MPTRTIAGDCIVRFDGSRDRHLRGRVLVVVKPDDTVLVHDADGYQPVAWLTRPGELTLTRDPLWLVAVDGDETLRVEAAGEVTVAEHDVGEAGLPVGDCRCGGPLVRARGVVACLDCEDRFPLPNGATVREETCDCGLPRFRVDRGETLDLCLDRDCGSLLAAVRERFDREWDCPDCGGDLEVLRRGGLLAGCERYPDCETGFGIPEGLVVGECDCGLPRFRTAGGERCLDTGCQEVA